MWLIDRRLGKLRDVHVPRDGVDPRLVVRAEVFAITDSRAALAAIVEAGDAALLQRDNIRALLAVDSHGDVRGIPRRRRIRAGAEVACIERPEVRLLVGGVQERLVVTGAGRIEPVIDVLIIGGERKKRNRIGGNVRVACLRRIATRGKRRKRSESHRKYDGARGVRPQASDAGRDGYGHEFGKVSPRAR